MLTAILTGAFWAGIAGVLKVTRGVSEVVATIMLNAIATSVIGYLWLPNVFGVKVGNNNTTGEMAESGWVPGIDIGAAGEIYGMVVLAVLLGIGYWIVLSRTRFGFDLRASGASETAAAASGVDPGRMVLTAMLISGGIAYSRVCRSCSATPTPTASTSPPASASSASASPCSAATARSASPSRPCCGPGSTRPRPSWTSTTTTRRSRSSCRA